MAFVGGLSGPYVRPIPVGASAAMFFSLMVAFVVTPWAAVRLLKTNNFHFAAAEGKLTHLYRKWMTPLVENPAKRNGFIVTIILLLLLSVSLVPLKLVTVKMLPFDNKSELQVIIDMPEGTTLEETARATEHIASMLQAVPEVIHYQTYIGTAAPYNFNGLVRHYFLRQAPNVADIQVNFLSKRERSRQSHAIASSLREPLNKVAALYGANIKIAEVPPGPPVLETLVAEVYGPDYQRQTQIAKKIETIFRQTDGVVDVDSYIEEQSPGYRFVIDQQKASMIGVNARDIADTMQLALTPRTIGLFHRSNEPEDVHVIAQIPRAERSSIEKLLRLKVRSSNGQLISLSELGRMEETKREQSIYHKNLMPVVYVTANVAGREESPVYAILKLKKKIAQEMQKEKIAFEQYSTHQPLSTAEYSMKWDGEWHITYEFFRDLGVAFAIVLLLIYIIVVSWFRSFTMPLVIMAVRFRPMALTAAAVIVGSTVIVFDPMFQGLAVSLMAGEVASLLLSRAAVPIFCYLLQRRQRAFTLPAPELDIEEGERVWKLQI